MSTKSDKENLSESLITEQHDGCLTFGRKREKGVEWFMMTDDELDNLSCLLMRMGYSKCKKKRCEEAEKGLIKCPKK